MRIQFDLMGSCCRGFGTCGWCGLVPSDGQRYAGCDLVITNVQITPEQFADKTRAFSYIICDAWSLPWYYVGASVFYSIGTSAYIALMLLTLIVGWKHAGRLNLRRHYMFLAIWANIFWLFYPVAFAIFSVKKEKEDWVFVSLICFGILDVLLVPGLAFMTLGLGTDWDVPGLVARFNEGPRFKKKKREHAEWNGISDDNAPGTALQSTAVPMHSVSPPPTAPPAPAGPPAGAQTAPREHANKDITPAAV
jgi:hypothetical protein